MRKICLINSLIYTLVLILVFVMKVLFLIIGWILNPATMIKPKVVDYLPKIFTILISILFLFLLIFVSFLHAWLEPLYVERNFAHVISCTSCACSIKCVQYCALLGVVLHTQIVSTCHVRYVQYYKLCIHDHVFGICYHRRITHDHAQSCMVHKECIV